MAKNSKTHTSAQVSNDMSTTLGASGSRPDKPKGPKRPPRVPMNAGKNLDVPRQYINDPDFKYRWFAESNIKGGRVAAAHAAWWEHVTDDQGKNHTRVSGTDTMYLMKLDMESWEEDQELKRQRVRATMEKEAAIGEGEYAPEPGGKAEGGTTAITRR